MDPLAALRSLADRWRSDAELLRRRGAPWQAHVLESAAEDLEQRLSHWWREPLTADQATTFFYGPINWAPEEVER